MLLSGVVAGLTFGIAIGRDWRKLERLQINRLPVLVLALAARAIAPLSPFPLVLDVLGIALTTVFGVTNWRLPGAPLVALGSLLNLIVILLNGAMPVDVGLLGAAGGRLREDAIHEPLTDR